MGPRGRGSAGRPRLGGVASEREGSLLAHILAEGGEKRVEIQPP